MAGVDHGHAGVAQLHGAAFVETDGVDAVLCGEPLGQVINADHRDIQIVANCHRVAGMVARWSEVGYGVIKRR